MDDLQRTEYDAAFQAGAASTHIEQSAYFAVIPEGFKVTDLEQFHHRPRRVRQKVDFLKLESLLAYLKDMAPDEAELSIYVNKNGFVNAVLDGHDDTDPGWCDHRAVFTPEETPEWKAWKAGNGRWISQLEFATFIEERAEDIVEPSAAEMLEVARNLSAKRNVEFQSKVDLTNGDVQFKYETTTGANRETGQIMVPETFTIGVRPFYGFEGYQVTLRLMYRIDNAKLTFTYKILQLETVREKAVAEVFEAIEAGRPGARLYWGEVPEPPRAVPY